MKYEKSLTMTPDTWSPAGPPVQLPTVDTTISASGMYRIYSAAGIYVTVSNAAISWSPNYNNGTYLHYYQPHYHVYLKAGDHIRSNSASGSYQRFENV